MKYQTCIVFQLSWATMRKGMVWLALAVLTGRVGATELRFEFSTAPTNAPPPDCVSTVHGQGGPGDWRVFLDEMPLTVDTNLFLPGGPARTTLKTVVGQLARDPTDNHYPMLMLGNGQCSDFTFTTRFKVVGGDKEQMAGVAFRVQDEDNFYLVRANLLTGTFYFFKYEKGVHAPPIGNNIKLQTNEWH